LFIADVLENGAGYSSHLGQEKVLRRVLDRILGEMANSFESPRHSDVCDTSCPDCLRSYDNRQLHAALHWRLALDVADLVVGYSLKVERWLPLARLLAASFASGFRDALPLEVTDAGTLPAVWSPSNRSAIFLAHPLWRSSPQFFEAQQVEAEDNVRDSLGAERIASVDVFSFAREPYRTLTWLIGSTTG
jgi:DEAD/DEAH box helicase domain-containing protein